MLSSVTHIAIVVACLAVTCHGQGNYLDDDDFALPARPAYRPPARPAPAPQPAAPRPTPVPILKQINRHNEDGSYTYGYEGADGSYKIETKLTTGEVMGKYGYVDDVGKVRVVEYGANKYGFMPQGEGTTVAPPTLVDETTNVEDLREQPQRSRLFLDDERVRYNEEERPRAAPRPAPRPVFVPEERPAPVYRAPAPQQAPQPAPYKPVSYKPAAPAYRPAPRAPSPAPVPQRAVIHGAAPTAPISRPAPVYEEPRPAPQQAYRPAPQPAYRPPPPPPQQQPSRDNYARSSPSILDQLERDYALPQSSASSPYHDVSFGSF